MKRIITLFFVIAFMSLTSASVSASVVKEEKVLDLTEVIAIVDGVEITRGDVDENGLINNDVFLKAEDQKKESNSLDIESRYSIPSTLYVKKGKNALMIKTLAAPRFSQQVDSYFLAPESAKTFAYKLVSSSDLSIVGNGIIGVVLGYKANPHYGAIYTVVSMLQSLRLNNVKNEILALANSGKSVEVRIVKTSMSGTLYAVKSWNGTTINTNLTNTDTAREKVIYYNTN